MNVFSFVKLTFPMVKAEGSDSYPVSNTRNPLKKKVKDFQISILEELYRKNIEFMNLISRQS